MNTTEFEAAVTRLRPRLRRIAAQIVGWSDADDVVQTTLINAWRDRDKIQTFEAYLVTQITDDAKNCVAGVDRTASEGTHLERERLADFAPPRAGDSEDKALTQIVVHQVLDKLPEDIRAAVWAVYAEGVSWEDAAEEAGVAKRTLHDRVAKWLPYLREQLGRPESPSSRANKYGGTDK